jgi:hypothetical protein
MTTRQPQPAVLSSTWIDRCASSQEFEIFTSRSALLGIGHIDDHDLERYHLGMVTEELELARIEEHLLWCEDCVRRAEESADYVDLIRAGINLGNWDASFTGAPGLGGDHTRLFLWTHSVEA